MTNTLKMCSQCGSAAVEFTALAGSKALCTGCGWEGTKEELMSLPVPETMDGEHLVSMVNDLRKLLSGELGFPYLKFLLKWGFIPEDTYDANDIAGTLDRKMFSKYLAAIAKAIIESVMQERANQERGNVKARVEHTKGLN